MRKSVISSPDIDSDSSATGTWLDLATIATTELTSEDPQHPFEQALSIETAGGWKASAPGPQRIRLRFDNPQAVRRVRLQFREEQVDRSQEIALFALSNTSARTELRRQQWTFSQGGSTVEVEDYTFDLKDVAALELEIDPGRHDKQVFASLESMQVG